MCLSGIPSDASRVCDFEAAEAGAVSSAVAVIIFESMNLDSCKGFVRVTNVSVPFLLTICD